MDAYTPTSNRWAQWFPWCHRMFQDITLPFQSSGSRIENTETAATHPVSNVSQTWSWADSNPRMCADLLITRQSSLYLIQLFTHQRKDNTLLFCNVLLGNLVSSREREGTAMHHRAWVYLGSSPSSTAMVGEKSAPLFTVRLSHLRCLS